MQFSEIDEVIKEVVLFDQYMHIKVEEIRQF